MSDTVTTLTILGMSCANCERHVTAALSAVPGVASVQVSAESGVAVVRWSGPDSDDATLVSAVDDAGYVARAETPSRH